MRRLPATALAVLVALAGAACGDDDSAADVREEIEDSVDDVREDVEDAAGAAGARAVAEAFRGALLAEDLEPDQTLRDVDVLEAAADGVPGTPDISGIEDADGDGRDDDGEVEAATGDQAACVTVAENGEVEVAGESCS